MKDALKTEQNTDRGNFTNLMVQYAKATSLMETYRVMELTDGQMVLLIKVTSKMDFQKVQENRLG